jgi:hypothetical protein
MRKFLPLLALALFAIAAGSSLAAPAQRFPIPDETQVNINVCTGNWTTIMLSNRVLVIHDDVDPNGAEHQTGTITGDIATGDGFSGRLTVHFGMNVQSPDPIVGEFVNTASLTLQGGTGQVIVIHAVFHVTIPPADVGEPKGSIDIVSAECLGNSS